MFFTTFLTAALAAAPLVQAAPTPSTLQPRGDSPMSKIYWREVDGSVYFLSAFKGKLNEYNSYKSKNGQLAPFDPHANMTETYPKDMNIRFAPFDMVYKTWTQGVLITKAFGDNNCVENLNPKSTCKAPKFAFNQFTGGDNHDPTPYLLAEIKPWNPEGSIILGKTNWKDTTVTGAFCLSGSGQNLKINQITDADKRKAAGNGDWSGNGCNVYQTTVAETINL